jgi:predicted NBD/HSP70 family sugar kinase
MGFVRAIDGGGNGFRRADISLEGEVLNFASIGPVNSPKELIGFATEDLQETSEGLVYSIAAVVEEKAKIIMAPNIHILNGVNLAEETGKSSKLRTLVMNDMEAAVRGMASLLPEEDYFLAMTWSSGIGMRVWNRGQILSGSEGGHMALDPSASAPRCGCGKRGHAEAIIGGDAIRRRILEETKLRGIKLPPGEPATFLDASWAKGEEWAVEMYKIIAQDMGLFLANVQSLLQVPLIVWKGTFAIKALKNLEPSIRECMEEHLISPEWASPEALRFMISPDPQKDALIGGAAAFRALKKS